MMCGLAPALLIGSTQLGTREPTVHDPHWALTLWILIPVGLRFAWVVATKPQRFFEVVFWLFTYVFLGLAPMVQLRTGQLPETIPVLDTSLNLETILLIIAGSITFALGLALGGGDSRTRQRVRKFESTTAPHRLLILCAVSMLFSTYYASRLGLGVLFGPRDSRSAIEGNIWPQTVNAVVKAGATFPLIICFTGLMRWRRERKAIGLPGPTWLPVLVFVLLAVVVNPISVPRYYAGTAILAVAAGLGAISTPRRARIFALAIAFGLVLGFPYASAARTTETTTLADRGGPARVLASADFDAFDQINNSIAYVRANGPAHGQQFSGAMLFFVPRAVWTSKPEDTGPLLADFREYKVTNLSSPIFAELFVDGGWALVLVGMAAIGFGVRRVDLRAVRETQRGSSTALAVVLPFYMIILLRGSLLQAMAGLAVLVTTGLFVGGRKRVETA